MEIVPSETVLYRSDGNEFFTNLGKRMGNAFQFPYNENE